MLHFFAHVFGPWFRDWDHRSTLAGAVVGLSVAPTAEVCVRLLSSVALLVGIYCSVDRNLRERRAEAKAEARRSADRP